MACKNDASTAIVLSCELWDEDGDIIGRIGDDYGTSRGASGLTKHATAEQYASTK